MKQRSGPLEVLPIGPAFINRPVAHRSSLGGTSGHDPAALSRPLAHRTSLGGTSAHEVAAFRPHPPSPLKPQLSSGLRPSSKLTEQAAAPVLASTAEAMTPMRSSSILLHHPGTTEAAEPPQLGVDSRLEWRFSSGLEEGDA